MIQHLVVETNWVLQLVYKQEYEIECTEILQLGEQGKIKIILPSICHGEAASVIENHIHRLNNHLQEAREFADKKFKHTDLRQWLEDIVLKQKRFLYDNHQDIYKRIDRTCLIYPFTPDIIEHAVILRANFPFDFVDSLIVATVIDICEKGIVDGETITFPIHFLEMDTKISESKSFPLKEELENRSDLYFRKYIYKKKAHIFDDPRKCIRSIQRRIRESSRTI